MELAQTWPFATIVSKKIPAVLPAEQVKKYVRLELGALNVASCKLIEAITHCQRINQEGYY